MNQNKSNFIGIDLFAGAGGLSLGAKAANIQVDFAVEKDKHAAATYKYNHPETEMINEDIQNITNIPVNNADKSIILFGGPPCQGFSSSNRRTRNTNNPSNWLLDEFIRIADVIKADWVVFENVRGFVNTEKNMFFDHLINSFSERGYTCTWYMLNAADYGVPQRRSRFFLIGSKQGYKVPKPTPNVNKKITVDDAIADLPFLSNGANEDYREYKSAPRSEYASTMCDNLNGCSGHLVTKNSSRVVDRYKYIPQGGNWQNIPEELMENYSDRTRCHTGIYHRLNSNTPALTIGNYRKAMVIHPREDRGLSVREAARIQSFPDCYEFKGSIGYQQQQVGNAVPPLLGKAVFESITNGDYII